MFLLRMRLRLRSAGSLRCHTLLRLLRLLLLHLLLLLLLLHLVLGLLLVGLLLVGLLLLLHLLLLLLLLLRLLQTGPLAVLGNAPPLLICRRRERQPAHQSAAT
eukprot:SAG22_NODE_1633_length_3930_cov_1.860872_3_plen_104_part_00